MFRIFIFKDKKNRNILYAKELNNCISLLDNGLEEGIYDITQEEFLDIIRNNCHEEYYKFKKIIESRDINLLKHDGSKYVHYSICLHPTRECNLACKYCFANKQDYLPDKGLDIGMAKKAIDYLIYDVGKSASRYTVDLSGSGEPLLAFNLIKEIEDYCEEKRNELGKDIKIMFPTNATLMDKDKAKYFDNKPNILLGISLDGNKNLNSNRVFKDKTETYEKVEKVINTLNRNVGLAVTITHNNESVDEIFDHLYKFKNVDAISMQIVRDYCENSEGLGYKIDSKNLIYHYKLLVGKLEEHLNIQDYNYLFTLLRGVDTFGTYIVRVATKGILNRYRCGGGKNRFTIDNEGNLYTCAVVTGDEYFKIGNIYNGIDIKRQRRHLKINTNTSRHCKECWCSYVCSGECPVVGYLANGDIYEPDKFLCNIRRELIKISIEFVQNLKDNNKEAYNELVEFSKGKSNYELSDSGIWAINKYLKSRGIHVDYSDLCLSIPRSNKGVSPLEMTKFIKKYKSEFDAIIIDNLEEIKNIKFPAIMCNIKGSIYRYSIIEEVESGYLKLKTLEDNVFNLSIQEILENSYIILTSFDECK